MRTEIHPSCMFHYTLLIIRNTNTRYIDVCLLLLNQRLWKSRCGRIIKSRCGRIIKSRCGRIIKSRCGRIIKSRCGRIIKSRCGRIIKSRCGRIIKSRCGRIIKSRCGRIIKSRCGRIIKSRCGRIIKSRCGRISTYFQPNFKVVTSYVRWVLQHMYGTQITVLKLTRIIFTLTLDDSNVSTMSCVWRYIVCHEAR